MKLEGRRTGLRGKGQLLAMARVSLSETGQFGTYVKTVFGARRTVRR
jgi:hypothetical protein